MEDRSTLFPASAASAASAPSATASSAAAPFPALRVHAGRRRDDASEAESDGDDDGGGGGGGGGGGDGGGDGGGGDADELRLETPAKRWTYKPHEKQACLAVLLKAHGDKAAALKAIHRTAGYEKVTYVNLKRWQVSTAKKNMGRGVNVGFERAVIGHLILTVLEKVE